MAALSAIMTVMMRAAEKAGRGLMRDFGEVENLQVSEKSPGQFVTAADKRAEETIHFNLSKDRPDFGFLMEEHGEIKGNDPTRRFIIDPIDGTHNFMHGIPHWCISIALEEKGEITAALIADPLRHEMFFAEKGAGAFINNNRRLRVSGRRDLRSAIIASWFVYGDEYVKNENRMIKHEDEVRRQCGHLRQMGSACLEYAYIAAGRMDGFFQGPLSPWDNAAGSLIIREAGGLFTNWEGKKENAVYDGFVIAGNPDIHRALYEIAVKGK